MKTKRTELEKLWAKYMTGFYSGAYHKRVAGCPCKPKGK